MGCPFLKVESLVLGRLTNSNSTIKLNHKYKQRALIFSELDYLAWSPFYVLAQNFSLPKSQPKAPQNQIGIVLVTITFRK